MGNILQIIGAIILGSLLGINSVSLNIVNILLFVIGIIMLITGSIMIGGQNK